MTGVQTCALPISYVKECEDKGNTLVIRPEEALNIGSRVSDPEELQRVYDIGRQTALKRIEEVKTFMAD